MQKKAPSFVTIGIALTLLCTLIGELYRFHGYLLLDLFVPLFVASWLAKELFRKRLTLNKFVTATLPKTTLPALLFVLIGFSSLLIHSGSMTNSEFLGAAFYDVRWISLFGLSIIVFHQSEAQKKHTFFLLAIFTFLLTLAGFIQLKIAPDFTAYEDLGWDPHQNRLLSTWFDPNFIGGFLAFILPIFLGTLLDQKTTTKNHRLIRLSLFALLLFSGIALTLTLSRSAYLAFLVALLIFGLLHSLKMLTTLGVCALLLLSVSSGVQDRVLSLVENIESFFTETYTLPDASARHRFESWEEGWELFLDEPLLGQGYNRYKYAALETGTLKDTEIHSASGSDASLLNILATTGLLGFFPFAMVYCLLAKTAWTAARGTSHMKKSGYALGFFSGLCGLFVHSVFVNSLLFPLLLAPFWISAGLLSNSPKAISE